MHATLPPRRWTVEEVLALPADGNRYEVVHGELLVTPSPAPRHQVVIGRIQAALWAYLDRLGVRDAMPATPVDYFHEHDVYVQPDLVVVVPQELTNDWHTMRHLRLAVEVISPSSARGDRIVKRPAYQAAGVETCWIVDPERAVVEVWRPGDEEPEIAGRELVWRVTPEAPELRLDLTAVFAPLPGETRR
jgi:Uma2 family endonuclease